MKKAILCIGNELRGDDGVAPFLGHLIEQELKEWKVFFGEDTPENLFGEIREFCPEILIVADAVVGFFENSCENLSENFAPKVEFLNLSDERDYIYSTHNLPSSLIIGYLRKFCPKTFFLGIGVEIQNTLEISQILSQNAKISAKIALEKIKILDAELKI